MDVLVKKRGENKRGQSEVSLGTILLLILGLVALIMIIIGVTTGFGEFFGAFGLLPDDLTKMATACQTYAGNEALRLSYCQYYEGRIQGKKGWYNCDYVHKVAEDTLGPDKVGFSKLNICAVDIATSKCTSLKNEKGTAYKDSVWVSQGNDAKSCKEWGVTKESASSGVPATAGINN